MARAATLQLDVDSYQDILADCGYLENRSRGFRTIYQTAVPRFLELFARLRVKATFFVVGRDASVPENREILREVARQGHEIANHTMSHPTQPCFSSLSRAAQEEEIVRGEEAVFEATGVRTRGFKSPAWSIADGAALDVLERRGYLYDSSVYPLLLAPAVRLGQYLLTGRKRAPGHFGSARNGLAPLEPYHPSHGAIWRRGKRPILEVPASTMPLLRLPFHASVAHAVGIGVFRVGYSLARLTGSFLNYQLHAFDLADAREVDARLPPLRPGSERPLSAKMDLIERIVANIAADYRIAPTAELIQEKLI